MSDETPVAARDFAVEEAQDQDPPPASSSAAAHPFRSVLRSPQAKSSPLGQPSAAQSPQPLQSPQLQTTSSFVYPARSLLSRNIQPATEAQQTHNLPARPTMSARYPSEDAHGRPPLSPTTESASRPRRGSFHQEDFGAVPALIRSASLRTQPKTSTQTQTSMGRRNTEDSRPIPGDASAQGQQDAVPMITVGDLQIPVTTFAQGISAAAALTQIASEPTYHLPSSPSTDHASDYFTTPEAPETETGSDGAPSARLDAEPAQATGTDGGAALETNAEALPAEEPAQIQSQSLGIDGETRPDGPLNLSQAGIVHLGPLRSTTSTMPKSQGGSQGSEASRGRSLSRRSASPTNGQTVAEDQNDESAQSITDDESGVPPSTASSEEPLLVTHKFDFVSTDDGHHIVTGREGKLTRCEDEPIRTPGAVQGYGVLIALEENLESGSLTVRQVSENSYDVLGLAPKFLFSLECFTDCLPERNVDAFWDNIQFLSAPEADGEPNMDSGEDSIHVFLLSGWGQPGSAGPNDIEVGPQGRRVWHCWCAAHRPQPVTSSTGDGPATLSDPSGTIILEFELERDIYNPLYPPPTLAESLTSGSSSPQSSFDSMSTTGNGSAGTGGGSGGTGGSAGTGHRSVSTGVGSAGTGRSGVGSTGTGGSGSSAAVSTSTLSGGTLVSGGSSDGAPTGSTAAQSIADSLPPTDTPHTSLSSALTAAATPEGLVGTPDWQPSPEYILDSTTNRARPLPALERLRQMNRALSEAPSPSGRSSGGGSLPRRRAAGRRGQGGGSGVGMMDIFAVMSQINEQLGSAQDLETFLKVTVGVIKDLTQFHRVLVYQFDESWNGQVVAELVDWHRTHDLYMGLHFPASDIPAQARNLYAINKVRLLYDRDLPTARLVVRSKEDLDAPLNMTHCYLRAMSPIHIKYLGNMGVRASMSISIMAFGALWGLVACHSYGPHGMRVSFPVRQMLRLLSQSISRNIERLSYAQRLHTRKLINTVTSDAHPGGYIVSNADDLLALFDADYGMLVIGEGAKILGPNVHGQEILIVAEYLRLKQFNQMQVSQAVTIDYPDLKLSTGLEVIAGLLYVPLSSGGKDFIAFLRRGQPREVHWAGRPHKEQDAEQRAILEPRSSFKAWSQVVAGRSRVWTDEQLETAGVLALVYGKFIEVWRQKESALQSTKLTNLLLSNASHEVRTPLNHIINYLELALNGPLDGETRDNLKKSHSASKSLLFTINDLLDLTRLETGNEISFNEPFDLHSAIEEASRLYQNEAARRQIEFKLDIAESPQFVVGDSKKIQTVVANLTGNALKYTDKGSISVICRAFDEPHGLRNPDGVAVEIVVADTGCGISSAKLESIFREFEQVESMDSRPDASEGVGLGLAVVAHIVEQLGGQLRVDSKVGEGSRFSFLIPFAIPNGSEASHSPALSLLGRSRTNSANSSARSARSEIDNFVQAIGASHLDARSVNSQEKQSGGGSSLEQQALPPQPRQPQLGYFEVTGSSTPIRGLRRDEVELDEAVTRGRTPAPTPGLPHVAATPPPPAPPPRPVPPLSRTAPRSAASGRHQKITNPAERLRILIVEDDDINRTLLAKRLVISGHEVENTTNGQECVDKVSTDRNFDCILMDVQMPILNGFEATEAVRAMEQADDSNAEPSPSTSRPTTERRRSHQLNGRIPIFAVSASLREDQRDQMRELGLDGWILKPVDFKRLFMILKGITDTAQREKDLYDPKRDWEFGGWLTRPKDILEGASSSQVSATPGSSAQASTNDQT